MKKFVVLFSLSLIFLLSACWSSTEIDSEIEDNVNTENNISDPQEAEVESPEELSEEEINALFEEMMQQVEDELADESMNNDPSQIEPELQWIIDESGELNPGLVDE